MLPVFFLLYLALVGRSQGHVFPFLGRPGLNFGNGFQRVNVGVMPNFVDNNFGPAVMPNFVDNNFGPAVMPNFVDNNFGPAVMSNFVDNNVGPAVMPNFVDNNVGPGVMPTIVDNNFERAVMPNFVDNNFGPGVMPNFVDNNFERAVMPNIVDNNFGPGVMPNVVGNNVGPGVMPNVVGNNVGPGVMPNFVDNNIGPGVMPNIVDNNFGPGVIPNVVGNNVGPGVMSNFVDNNVGPGVMPNIVDNNFGPGVMPNVVGNNVGPAVMPNFVDNNVGPAVRPNLPRQNNIPTVASANQQRGLARILPFPPVIPQIPDRPRISVPNPGFQTNNLAFDDFGRQQNTANDGGAMVGNLPQQLVGNGGVPMNVGSGFQRALTLDDINQGQGPILPMTNLPNGNRDVFLDRPAVMPAIPTFNTVEGRFEGRFNAGLDFNDPRIRTQSAAIAAANFDGPRINTNGLGQNLIPQNIGIDGLGAGPNFGFDQNLALGPGFQGGANFEPGLSLPGDGFQFNQPEQFPFNIRQGGINENGLQFFNPGTQFPDNFQQPSNFPGVIGGLPQGVGPSLAPFEGNVFPGLTFPDQTGNNFIPQIGNDFNLGGNNVFANVGGLNNFPTDATVIGADSLNINGNDVTFPGGANVFRL